MFYNLNDGNYIQLQNNLSLKLNGIPLAGIDDSDDFWFETTSVQRMSDCGIVAWRTPYAVNLIITFTMTGALPLYTILEGKLEPETIPTGATEGVQLEMLLSEYTKNTNVATGNIRHVNVDGKWVYPPDDPARSIRGLTIDAQNTSDFRSGYFYTGQITYKIKQ